MMIAVCLAGSGYFKRSMYFCVCVCVSSAVGTELDADVDVLETDEQSDLGKSCVGPVLISHKLIATRWQQYKMFQDGSMVMACRGK